MFLLFPISLFAKENVESEITRIRVSSAVEKTRLVFDLNGKINYKSFRLDNPDRLVLDFKNTVLLFRIRPNILSNNIIQKIRSGAPSGDYVRLVIDLKKQIRFKCFVLDDPVSGGNRLVVDLFTRGSKVYDGNNIKTSREAISDIGDGIKGDSLNEQEIESLHKTKPKPKVTIPLHKCVRHDVVIVIDPGHGGKDPGAIGQSGTKEKDVVLAISKELKEIIDKEPGFRAFLTRDGDYFVGLRQRLHIAHKRKADMFIAIHADAYTRKEAQGASVFALSQRGATSKLAMWLAEKENESELSGVIADKDFVLKSILIDLTKNLTIQNSLKIGQILLNNLSQVAVLHTGRVEQAGFIVLKALDIPSLLVETGFISNREEEQKLQDSFHRRNIALALAMGIKHYFDKHPSLKNEKFLYAN